MRLYSESVQSSLISADWYAYFWWSSSWNSAGVTVSTTLNSGSLICYASDQYQTPSPGYANWTFNSTNDYTEVFLSPFTDRQIGSFLSIACLGKQSTNSFFIQGDYGRVLTTGMLIQYSYHILIIIAIISYSALTISYATSETLAYGSILYYNILYPANGLTLTLNVSVGSVACYASLSDRSPSQYDYDWKIDSYNTGRKEVCLDPAIFNQAGRPRVFASITGRYGGSNNFTLNFTRAESSAVGE